MILKNFKAIFFVATLIFNNEFTYSGSNDSAKKSAQKSNKSSKKEAKPKKKTTTIADNSKNKQINAFRQRLVEFEQAMGAAFINILNDMGKLITNSLSNKPEEQKDLTQNAILASVFGNCFYILSSAIADKTNRAFYQLQTIRFCIETNFNQNNEFKSYINDFCKKMQEDPKNFKLEEFITQITNFMFSNEILTTRNNNEELSLLTLYFTKEEFNTLLLNYFNEAARAANKILKNNQKI